MLVLDKSGDWLAPECVETMHLNLATWTGSVFQDH